MPGHEGRWRVTADVLPNGQVVSVRVYPEHHVVEPGVGIGARLLQTLKLDDVSAMVLKEARTFKSGRPTGWLKLDEHRTRLADAASGTTGTPRNRRSDARPDVFFVLLCRDYVELVEGGERAPTKTLAQRRGESVKAVSNALAEAKRRKLWAPYGIPGKAGGTLTPRAKQLLQEEL